jgi:predicted nucleotidyltransferase
MDELVRITGKGGTGTAQIADMAPKAVDLRHNILQDRSMNKAVVIARLREHEPELKAAGIARLFLFGSVARGERGNDVDLMAEFDESRRLTLFDKAGLEVRLAEILDVPVDLCDRQMLKEPVRARAEREAVLAFS